MRRYDSYKDSGVEWLGEVPSHWEIKRNIGLFDERKEVNRGDMDLLSVTITRGIIKQEEITSKKDSSTEDKTKYKLVRQGDLAYNKMRMWQGAIGASDYDGIVSPAYIVLRPRDKVYSRYFHYLYRTEAFIGEANRNSYGLCLDMNSLRYEDFKTIYSPVPPKAEVERIVAFLDEKTADIDAAIAKKERLIELLKEQKNILINRAVTHGLNPDVPMRDSGVEWIGAIPAHWQVKRLKCFSTVQSGITLGKRYLKKKLAKYLYLRVANIQDGYLSLDDMAEIEIPENEALNYRVRPGDILVTEGGDIDKLGRGAVWNGEIEDCLHQNHVLAIRIQTALAIPEYVALITGCDYRKRYFTTTANKTTNLASTNRTKLGNFPVVLPSFPEQERIFLHCRQIAADYDSLIQSTRTEIKALEELSLVFVSSAVTGKINVA